MTSKRQYDECSQRQTLRDAGWQVPKRDAVAFNGGATESFRHYLAKASIAWVLKQDGYRIASEVVKDGAGEIDLVAYGTEDLPVAIEVETGWEDEVLASKLERYVKQEPCRDILPVEVTEMPAVEDIQAWAEEQV